VNHNIKRKIWVDLDNSPHVPFFSPIINELKLRNYEIKVTARDCAQTCGLADLFEMNYTRIGRHYGKNKFLKVAGMVFRTLQLISIVKAEKPALALSHGSRAQIFASLFMGVPSLVIEDYEHATDLVSAKWQMMPEIISGNNRYKKKNRQLRYPGIKEDVYVPTFRPDPRLREDLGIGPEETLVTIRPPATEAHYHNPEAEALFSEAVNYLGPVENVRMVILPRYDEQGKIIETTWPEWIQDKKIIIPASVVDGLNLLWYSDLAISGGGTMNREAAALGIPVYSIFRGKIGDVDRYLADTGRLVLLERVEDVKTKVKIEKRLIPDTVKAGNPQTLKVVVENIIKVVNTEQEG
jgi:predicted glycosyltransferase